MPFLQFHVCSYLYNQGPRHGQSRREIHRRKAGPVSCLARSAGYRVPTSTWIWSRPRHGSNVVTSSPEPVLVMSVLIVFGLCPSPISSRNATNPLYDILPRPPAGHKMAARCFLLLKPKSSPSVTVDCRTCELRGKEGAPACESRVHEIL